VGGHASPQVISSGLSMQQSFQVGMQHVYTCDDQVAIAPGPGPS
jgi:hypothetical protein